MILQQTTHRTCPFRQVAFWAVNCILWSMSSRLKVLQLRRSAQTPWIQGREDAGQGVVRVLEIRDATSFFSGSLPDLIEVHVQLLVDANTAPDPETMLRFLVL